MNDIHPLALFRLSVLGPLVSREGLAHGELKSLTRELASRSYAIPGSSRTRLSAKTIEAWFYAWKRGGIEALAPRPRADRGQSKLASALQEAILQAKRDNPRRSLNSIRQLLEMQGTVAQGQLSRSSIHRLLQRHGLSRSPDSAREPVERRRFEAPCAGDLWQGDVMHGPTVSLQGRRRKLYLVSLMDDASRLITHSAFCLGEKALDIEGVLKQAVLKRGLPKKLLIDNGPAYRAASLQGICARLQIRLIYCRPFEPAAKGKIERWHRTVRDQFLGELDPGSVRALDELNARWWAWLDQIHHRTVHSALEGLTPLERYQKDLLRVRPLGPLAARLDALFHHRHTRKVRKDATVSFQGHWFEVPYELAGQSVVLVVDPHTEQVVAVESQHHQQLGLAIPLDPVANARRLRRRPRHADPCASATTPAPGPTLVELAVQRQAGALAVPATDPREENT